MFRNKLLSKDESHAAPRRDIQPPKKKVLKDSSASVKQTAFYVGGRPVTLCNSLLPVRELDVELRRQHRKIVAAKFGRLVILSSNSAHCMFFERGYPLTIS